ncbi:metallopeptidase family protein [Streptomyces monomycini]|uniref:metallopeptidase family protein n=1 Tax=Streptomyces monomycini TaxID=371720 RepID=UPI000A749516|nr:metallopeptidase family protein [Streptomyces monomycini]
MDSPVPPPADAGGPSAPAGTGGTPAAPGGATRPPAPAGPRPRRRDRHGRGMRGPVAPPQVPLSVSRADSFVDLVYDSRDRLERRWPQLADVDFLVVEVPGFGPDGDTGPAADEETVPLGRLLPATGDQAERVVVYRRPVEIRTKNRDERALLVHEVVVEQVAELLGLAPESVDPRYGQD